MLLNVGLSSTAKELTGTVGTFIIVFFIDEDLNSNLDLYQ